MAKIVVIGGGTPHTVSLLDEIKRQWVGQTALHVCLVGRRTHNTGLVAQYAAASWGSNPSWKVEARTTLKEALPGADLIIHQARFGGLQGRASDETWAVRWAVPADETLGPTGLRAGLRLLRETRHLAEQIAAYSPRAWVVPMTNPLSITTQVLAERLGDTVVGVCDLPISALESISGLTGGRPEYLSYSYSGLNHRGFLHGINIGGFRLDGKIHAALQKAPLDWVDAQEFSELGAFPMAYHKVVKGTPFRQPGRALQLEDIAARALEQLNESPHTYPSALNERETPWYRKVVVPLAGALLRLNDFKGVLNLPGEPIARERLCVAAGGRIVPYPDTRAPAGISDWLRRFEAHERLVMQAVLRPSPATLRTCLEQDPVCPKGTAKDIAEALWAEIASHKGDINE